MAHESTDRFLIFSVGGSLFAFSSGLIGEVVSCERVYKMPLCPDYMLGLINRFGVPYALIDTAKLLAITSQNSRKAVVLKESVERVAFAIDDVIDIAEAVENSLMKVDKSGADESQMARFVSRQFSYNEQMVFELDVKLLLSNFENDVSLEI
ncbi:hypothetical protein FACS189487_02260 [Campylobacterota bacterium]|nr:hypothetical protein FACS189487_02260 [Campylobacterota bacterium]